MKRSLVFAFAAVVIFAVAASADLLSGVWSTQVCTDATGMFTSFDSSLGIDYEVCNWSLGVEFTFTGAGWTEVEFTADGVLGAFIIENSIAFTPAGALFIVWTSDIVLEIAGITLTVDFETNFLPRMYLTLGISGDVGLCTLGAEVYLGGLCTLDFSGVVFNFGFPFACVEWVEIEATMGCGTFLGICFDIDGLQLSGIDWLIFDLGICFDDGAEGKTFTFVPALALGDYDCITLYAELVEGAGFEFDGIDVYGLEIYYEWEDGVYFQSVSSFEVDKNDDLIHASGEYWEKICIGTVGDSCCGGGFDFELCVYFQDTSAYLFDVGLVEASLGFGIGSNFGINGSISAGVAGLNGLCLGFDVSW